MNLTNLKHEADKIRMTLAEKSAMRARIFSAPAASPYFHFSFQFLQAKMLVPLVILIVLIGSGTAYAAQGALPGEVLYAVKVNVDERVEGALATTQKAKAQWHAAVAARRLVEAETLAARGMLDATTTASLALSFDEHADEADTLTEGIRRDDPEEAAHISSEFRSSFKEHTEILARLSEHDGTTTRENSRVLTAAVRKQEHKNDERTLSIRAAAAASSATSTASTTLTTGSSPHTATSSDKRGDDDAHFIKIRVR